MKRGSMPRTYASNPPTKGTPAFGPWYFENYDSSCFGDSYLDRLALSEKFICRHVVDDLGTDPSTLK